MDTSSPVCREYTRVFALSIRVLKICGAGRRKLNLLALHSNVARLQIREIDSGDNLAMHQHQQPVSGEKIRQHRILFRAAHDFIHRVDHRLQPLQPLNAIDHGGLAHINGESSARHSRPHMAQQRAPEFRESISHPIAPTPIIPEKQSNNESQHNAPRGIASSFGEMGLHAEDASLGTSGGSGIPQGYHSRAGE